jgi:hypothetical protein
MLRSGMSRSQAARELGVTPSAITQAAQELDIHITKSVQMAHANQIVAETLDTIGQLRKINENANFILDLTMLWAQGDKEALKKIRQQHAEGAVGLKGVTGLSFKDPKELAVKVMAEIRSQLKLQLDLFQSLYNFREVEAFQREVLEAIGEENVETRRRIIERLKQRRALRSAVRVR